MMAIDIARIERDWIHRIEAEAIKKMAPLTFDAGCPNIITPINNCPWTATGWTVSSCGATNSVAATIVYHVDGRPIDPCPFVGTAGTSGYTRIDYQVPVPSIDISFGVGNWARQVNFGIIWQTQTIYRIGSDAAPPPAILASERLRRMIAARQAPIYLPLHRQPLKPTDDVRELRARSTFRRIVGEKNWRSYCARGYVSVRGKSGRVYQIFSGHDVTRVYEGHKLVERLCVVLAGGPYPPTDSILMRYVLILSDEATFNRLANRTAGGERRLVKRQPEPVESLAETWRRSRGVAA